MCDRLAEKPSLASAYCFVQDAFSRGPRNPKRSATGSRQIRGDVSAHANGRACACCPSRELSHAPPKTRRKRLQARKKNVPQIEPLYILRIYIHVSSHTNHDGGSGLEKPVTHQRGSQWYGWAESRTSAGCGRCFASIPAGCRLSTGVAARRRKRL